MALRIAPISVFPATAGKVYPDCFRTSNNAFWIDGMGVMASLDGDAEIHYLFQVPKSLPTGTGKFELRGLSYNAGGDAAFNPKWKSIDYGEDMDLAVGSLNAEGESTLSWTYGADAHEWKLSTINLDADTLTADEFVMLRLALVSANWTLNQRSVWIASILWE